MAATLPKHFLVNGISIPAIGFGTFQSDSKNERVKDLVLEALKHGYRHIDTAYSYGNEKEIGQAIRKSGIPRKELFVTTKLAQTFHNPEDVERAMNKSLEYLQLDYVDLYLMHFPHAYAPGPNNETLRHENGKPVIDHEISRDYVATWKAMEKLVETGKTRLIGVSNFNILKLTHLLENASIPPAVNQVELHPYLPQPDLLAFCAKNSIHLTAHQPLGGNPVAAVNPNADRPGPLLDPKIQEIATKNSVTPAQVILSWTLHRGTSVIPKTVQISRMVENISLPVLRQSDLDIIDHLVDESRAVRFLDPSGHIGFDIFDEERDQPLKVILRCLQ